MPDVTLVGVLDIDRSRAAQCANELGVRAFHDYGVLSGQAVAVSVTVPASSHFDVCRGLLGNGISILVEKPITRTREEADELVSLASRTGCTLQVGHIERYNPVTRSIRALGWHPQEMEFRRLQCGCARGCDVSVILELMVHDIDLALALADDDVADIQAFGRTGNSGQIDTATADLRMRNGCRIRLIADRVSDHCERTATLHHPEGTIAADWAKRELLVRDRAATSEQRQSFASADPLADELHAFVNAVRSGREPDVTATMGRNALDVALRIAQHIEDRGGHG